MSGFSTAPFDATYAEAHTWLLERVRDRPAKYARTGPNALAGISDEAIQMLIARGSELGRELAPLVPLVEDAITTLTAKAGQGDLSFVYLGALDIFGALAASGVTVKAFDATPILSAIVTSRGDEPVNNHWHRGFAALALKVPAVYREIAGLDDDEEIPFTPGQTFGPNTQGCLKHFAGAIAHGASLDDCMPAWADLARYSFSGSQGAMFTDAMFLWGAWILQHRIAHQPIATVADWMHASLYGLAG